MLPYSSFQYSDLDVLEARRRGAVRDMRRLRRLALAAVGQPPDRPFTATGDCVVGVPELRRDAGIGRVLDQPAALAVDDFVGQLGAELEIEPLVVDAPTPGGLHIHTLCGFGNHLLQRRVARLQADIRHANEGYPVPAVGPHRAIALLAENARGLP